MPVCYIKYSWGFFPVQQVWISLQNNAARLGIDHRDIENALQSIALAIDTRGQILRTTVQEAKTRMSKLEQSVPNNRLQAGKASVIVDASCLYGMLGSIDSFLFESWSLYNLLKRFYICLLRRAKLEPGKRVVESFNKLVAKTRAADTNDWLAYLEANRHLLYHETAPYAAIEFTTGDPIKREVLIESQPDEYLRKAEFDNVLKGLSALSDMCVQDLCTKVGNRSTSERRT